MQSFGGTTLWPPCVCPWRPRRDNRQQTDDGRSRRSDLQVGVLPALATADNHQVAVNRKPWYKRLDYCNSLLYTASLMIHSSAVSLCMQQHALCRELVAATTSHRCGPAIAALAAHQAASVEFKLMLLAYKVVHALLPP